MSDDDYKWEVFVSYRRTSIVEDWLPNFLEPLEKWLTEELLTLGWKPPQPKAFARIFTDQKIRAGTDWKLAIREAVRTSRCAVTIWLPTYFQSDWCVAEWSSFRGRANELVVPIRFHDGVSFPAAAQGVQMFDFEKYTSASPAFKKTPKYVKFEARIKQLARRLAEVAMAAPPFPNPQLPPNWLSPDLDKLSPLEAPPPTPHVPLTRW